MRGLQHRTVLVTGATGLIGRAIVSRFVLEEDANVWVASRSLDRAQKLCGALPEPGGRVGGAAPVAFDLTRSPSIEQAFGHMASNDLPPDVLIACARGAWDATNRLQQMIQIDVVGHIRCAELMVEQTKSHKSIVWFSSIYGLAGVDARIYDRGASGTPVDYSATKAAVLGVVRHLAAQWAPDVRVNALVAGGVRAGDRQNSGLLKRYSAKTMLGRMAQPEEIAAAAAFLASDESSYITGASLHVDGGFLAW